MPKAPKYTARPPHTADKHVLYEEAVQQPDAELDFLTRVYKARHGVKPTHVREDFCGTAANCCAWVKRAEGNRAVGVDLDKPTLLEHSERHTRTLTAEQRTRLTLLHENVLAGALTKRAKTQVILALNFSYWIFKQRRVLLEYFVKARAALRPGGMFILDFFGGADVMAEMVDRRRCAGFTYLWDQAKYDPFTGDYLCHIHFEFRDGTKMRKAFTYDWRVWTMPELKDLLAEAGFSRVETYGEGTTKAGRGNGVFTKRAHHAADRTLIAYIVAER